MTTFPPAPDVPIPAPIPAPEAGLVRAIGRPPAAGVYFARRGRPAAKGVE